MRLLSQWGKQHVWPARLLIILLHLVLIAIALYWALLVTENGWTVSADLLYVLIGIYGAMFLAYQSKVKWKKMFWYRIIMHTGMAVVSFMLVFLYAATLNKPVVVTDVMAASVIDPVYGSTYKHAEAEKLLQQIKNGEVKKLSKAERKLLRSEFKFQVKRYTAAKRAGQKDEAGKAGLIILTIIVALAAILGVGAISCSLSCNGNDGAAVAVAVLGTALIIFLVILAIKGIKKGKPTNSSTKNDPPS
ncbi:MAG TPA: hypothetical protein VFV46_11420 [Lacibacter sp.]|nr:hypothetical protein [Lacibacter sp.]